MIFTAFIFYTIFIQINQIRYSMDTLLFTLPNQVMSDSISDSGKATLCKKIQELIIK